MAVRYDILPKKHLEDAVAILAEALMVEPGFAHIMPDEGIRRAGLRLVIADMVDHALSAGTCWAAIEDDQVLGVGVWSAPGKHSHDVLNLEAYSPLGQDVIQQLDEFGRNASLYFPAGPFWYLEALGVAPAAQGKGVGSRLLPYMLEQIGDAACYLETATEANIRFYQRFGFEVLDPAAQLTPNNGPTHWTMLRPAS